MRIFVTTMALLLAGAGVASAQDEKEQKLDQLRREMERSMRSLKEKFDAERERLEKEFKVARERLLEKKDGEPKEGKPRDFESLVEQLQKRVDALEKKVERELPKLRELPRMVPKDFEFKKLPDGLPEEWRRWLEQMPRFKGGEDFKFEFRKQEKKGGDGDEPEKPKKKKKQQDDDSF